MVNMLPGKQGSMVFSSMMKLNEKRPMLGNYVAGSITSGRSRTC